MRGWTSPVSGMTPVAASPRMASPRSVGSILMISAPQSARRAEAAGTNVCSATSRTRTPFITAVALTATLPLTLTSTSILDGCHLEHHLAHGPALGHVGQGGCRLFQPERRPDQGLGLPLGQQSQQLGVVAHHFVAAMHGEVAELEAENVDSLQEHQIKRYAGDGPRGVADGDEAPVV